MSRVKGKKVRCDGVFFTMPNYAIWHTPKIYSMPSGRMGLESGIPIWGSTEALIGPNALLREAPNGGGKKGIFGPYNVVVVKGVCVIIIPLN